MAIRFAVVMLAMVKGAQAVSGRDDMVRLKKIRNAEDPVKSKTTIYTTQPGPGAWAPSSTTPAPTLAPTLAPTPAPTACQDTQGWKNGDTHDTQYSCEGDRSYVSQGWCANGKVVAKWTTGSQYNYPERHCCACGGGSSWARYLSKGAGACRNNLDLYDNIGVKDFHGSLAECQDKCDQTQDCVAISYMPTTGHCLFTDNYHRTSTIQHDWQCWVQVSDKRKPLVSYWSSVRNDNSVCATEKCKTDHENAKYAKGDVQGYVFETQQSDTIPLVSYWSSDRNDNSVCATEKCKTDHENAKYEKGDVQGYILKTQLSGSVPLVSYWSKDRNDNSICATEKCKTDHENAKYEKGDVQGYVFL